MTTQETPADLVGKLLIAMPSMGDPRFDHTVVFLCAHADDGAMGIIINRVMPEMNLDDLLKTLDIGPGEASAGRPVHFGGPVEGARGFVLHSADYTGSASTLRIDSRFAMTATKDVLNDIARGAGPDAALAALGYAGWGPGQLESEIQHNAWLTVEADAAIVFDPDNGGKWTRALNKLGIDPLMLSAEGGRA